VQIVRDAAAAGKHILLAKPFAHTYADAVAMVRAAEEAGVTLAVSQNRRWIPAHRATRVLIEDGVLGQPYSALYFGRSNQEYLVGSWYERDPHFLLVEFCVHHLDLLVYWLGEPESVFATTSRAPGQRFAHPMVAAVTFQYANGARAVLSMNDVAYDPGRGSYWDQDTYWIDGTQGILEKIDNRLLRLTSARTDTARVERQLTEIASFAASMGDLLNALVQRREPLCSGRRNLATMRTVFAACRSSDEGRVVFLEEFNREAGE
jgi:predicted dehydrogenase